jgi:hypothetical protein
MCACGTCAQLGSRGLNALAGLAALETLALPGTRVGDAGMRAVARFRHLRGLDLEDTLVSDEGAAARCACCSLACFAFVS